MTRVVYLVRHGQTALNAEGRLRGLLDPPLDPTGEHQVGELGAAFGELAEPPGEVVAGPLQRTRQTAAAIATALGLELRLDARLLDRDYGPWTGKPTAEVKARFGGDLARLPGAEEVADLVGRALEALEEHAANTGAPVVLVSHDAVLSHLLAELDTSLGAPGDITLPTASWSRLERDGGRWLVTGIGRPAAGLAETQ